LTILSSRYPAAHEANFRSAASGVHEDVDKQLRMNDGVVFAARDWFLLTPNKVDWKATPAMSLSDLEFVSEYVAPRNKIERWAATQCEEVLLSMTAKLRIVRTITTRGAIIHENPADIFNPTSTVDRVQVADSTRSKLVHVRKSISSTLSPWQRFYWQRNFSNGR